ncbi:hypothetical protein KSP40_PGU012354 [Platanthera guangdongensis]|uniref:FHA domain-containing protein n=1 Tax=Platanthera guangdongensis TaxID=2320717 RepID=A0ABR2MX63_9ASPA
MVWGLLPADTLRGATKYYILAQGTYKVGRKGCDIIVQIDTAVSRLHAEVIVDKMIPYDPCHATNSNSHVRVRDSSKYGTFVNKELGSKAVQLRHGEETVLKEGDTVTFGTGNATFRFCCVPFRIFIPSSMLGQVRSIQATASSIGATATSNWSTECTHVLVSESSSVLIEIIEAVLDKKLVALPQWLEVLAEKNICTELPSCTAYVPSLNLEDNLVRIVDPKLRENCLEGYTFVLGSSDKYKFGEKLKLLLKMIRARFVNTDDYLLSSQISADRENNQVVLVIPGKFASEFDHFREFSSLSRITDIKLMAAILSGHLESSFIELPSIIISSSHSTDETIVADSDVEMDTALSTRSVTNIKSESARESDALPTRAVFNIKSESVKENYVGNHTSKKHVGEHLENSNVEEIAKADVILVQKLDKSETAHMDRHENSDIIYSQGLLVRNTSPSIEHLSSNTAKSVNYKLFRKRETASGNSFRNLIPFSKDPYKEADYGRDELEYMRDEKKRKKQEAVAEELFNSEQLRKRAASGASLEAFLSRR